MHMAADADTCLSLSVHTQINIVHAVFSLCTSSAKFSSLFWEDMVVLQLRKTAENTGYIFLPVEEEEDGL